jgi:hypothetical protein
LYSRANLKEAFPNIDITLPRSFVKGLGDWYGLILGYDPANPAEAILEMRTGWGTWAQWLASGMMLALTLLATFFISR